MSFILQDKSLTDLLIRYGQATQPARQQYIGISPQDFTMLRSIIGNLEKQLSADPNAGPEITTGSGQAASLTSMNLKNLSELINFLGVNGVMVDGKNIVKGANEPTDASYVPYDFSLDDSNMRPGIKTTFKVNKELLEKYLTHLQANLTKNPNPVMNAQVQALVQEANEQLQTNVGAEYQQPDKVLRNDQVVDKIPQNFSTKNPLVEGNIPLTYGDIISDVSFNSWIQKNNIGIDGRAYKHPQYDKCGLIKGLAARAKSYIGNAASAQDKETYTVYAGQVPKLATMLQCDLGTSSDKPGVTENRGGQGAGAGGPGANVMQELIQILPLQTSDLDFGRIRDFINTYRSLITADVEAHRSQQANTAMDQLEQYMQMATKNTVGQSMTNFHMDGLTANDLISWAVPPSQGQATRSRGSARALADALEYVVRNTYTIVKDLLNSHYHQLQGQPEWNQAIQQQVGGPSIPFGSSIANSNIDHIQSARARLPQVGA